MHWLANEENLVYLSATISNMDVGYSDVIHCEVSVPIRK